jgi:hypothetical protein
VKASTLDAGQKRASGRSVDNVPEAFLGILQPNMECLGSDRTKELSLPLLKQRMYGMTAWV